MSAARAVPTARAVLAGWIALAGCVTLAAFPGVAQAHGPVAPIATAYRATVSDLPAGLDAKVVDGDQRLWLRVPAAETVVVLDYRGAPYLRFTHAGVAVNENSGMYYSNLIPAQVPPANLGVATPPRWSSVSGGHDYSWHDGRLHALAAVAVAPGTTDLGRWSIPLRVDRSPAVIAGHLWRADDPSLAWLWPIAVLLACVLAARRVRDATLDVRLGLGLSVAALAGTVVAAVGKELHGRPTVSILQYLTLAVVLAFVVWAARELWRGRARYFTYFAVGFVAIWQGLNLLPTLFNGFVLAALPPFVARSASVVCLGCGLGLLLVPPPSSDAPPAEEPDGDAFEDEDEDAVPWEAPA